MRVFLITDDLWQFNMTLLEWRYIKGFKTPNPSGFSSTTSFNPTNKPRGLSYQICFSHKDRLYVFGGRSQVDLLGYRDLYEFDIASSEWRVAPSWTKGVNPGLKSNVKIEPYNLTDRYGPGMLYQASGIVWNEKQEYYMVGGCIFNCNTEVNLIWRLDLDRTSPSFLHWSYVHGDIVSWESTTAYNDNPPLCYNPDPYLGIFESDIRNHGHFAASVWYSQKANILYYYAGAGNSGDRIYNGVYALKLTEYKTGVISGTRCFDYGQASPSNMIYFGNFSSYDFDYFNMMTPRYGQVISYGYLGMEEYIVFSHGINKYLEVQKDDWVYSISRNLWKPISNKSEIYINEVSKLTKPNGIYGGRYGQCHGQVKSNLYTFSFSGIGVNDKKAILPIQDTFINKFSFSECSRHGIVKYLGEPNIFLHTNYSKAKQVCVCENTTKYWGENCEFWKCYGYNNSDSRVCTNGFGICIDHNNCECSGNREGKECELEKKLVCSGHGNLVIENGKKTDKCNCSYGYYGKKHSDMKYFEDCNFWSCNGLNTTTNGICSSNGICKSFENCECSSNSKYYGKKCNEYINNEATFDKDRGFISIEYRVPILELFDIDEEFDCNILMDSISSKFGSSSKCQWVFSIKSTKELTIYPENLDSSEDEITLHPFTRKSESVTIKIEHYKRPNKDNTEPFTFGDFALYVFTWLIPLTLMFILIVFILMLFLLCGCCCVCYICNMFCCICCCSCYLFLKTRKYAGIKNIDIILREQKAEEESGIAHLRINRSLFAIDYSNVKLEKTIGKGGSGAVIYKANWNGLNVAFKVFKTKDLSQQDNFDEFEKEVSLLSSLKHPNILVFYGCCLQEPRIGIVMELCTKGDLNVYIERNRKDYGKGFLSIRRKVDIMMQIADGMSYLHEKDVIHRDLKSMNVLLSEDLIPKIIDFGLSRIREKSTTSSDMTRQTGTSIYMAPEVTTGRNYDHRCDIFSYAIVMFEVMSENFNPYGKKPGFSVELKVANDESFRPKFESEDFHNLHWYINIMTNSWKAEPDDRPSFSQISDTMREMIEMIEEEEEEDAKDGELEKEVIENIDSF